MDEDRIERALREGPPDEPAYVPGIGGRLTGGSDDLAETTAPAGVVTRARHGGLRLAGAIAAAIVVALAAVSLRPGAGPGPGSSGSTGDLLARIRAAGVVRIVVTSGPPQTVSAGGAVIGFDVDVAEALADALEIRPQVVAMPTSDILAGTGSWTLPSRRGPLGHRPWD